MNAGMRALSSKCQCDVSAVASISVTPIARGGQAKSGVEESERERERGRERERKRERRERETKEVGVKEKKTKGEAGVPTDRDR